MRGDSQSQPDRGALQPDRGLSYAGRVAGVLRSRRVQVRLIALTVFLLPLVVGIVLVIASFGTRSQAARSSFVQAHGARRTAVILSVGNVASTSTNWVGTGSSRHQVTSTSYSAQVLVRLPDPVGGQARTTVHVPSHESAGPGDTLTVLVDPDDPGYAELPGSPVTPADQPVVYLGVGAGLIVVAIALGVLLRRKGTALIDAVLNARGFWGISWRRGVRRTL